MGCSQSVIENEEAVSRCKDRKHLMKSAVAARNAFSSAHSSTSVALRSTGAAFIDFISAEVVNPPPHSSGIPIEISRPSPPPPPPIPDMTSPPLHRALTMPEFAVKENTHPGSQPSIPEEGEEDEEGEGKLRRRRRKKNGGGIRGGESNVIEPPPSLPPPVVEESPKPSPRATENSSWEDFFNVDMPYGGVGEIENEREKSEVKVFDEMPMKAHAQGKVSSEGVVEKVVEKPERVAEKPERVVGEKVYEGEIREKSLKKGDKGSEVKRKSNVNVGQVFTELDNCFLAAYESAQEVTKLLEAAKMHFHYNFADNRGHMNHSDRVLRVISWNRSFRGLPNDEEFVDDFDYEENETHATVLDKLLAWEKKLYDEVKAGEVMKFEYQRKVALLNKHKKRGSNSASLQRLKSSVSHMHTRYIVDMQYLDSTVSEINRLRDKQLYPKLVMLVDAMATMWDAMQRCHEKQLKLAASLKGADISQSTKETTPYLHERTIQLWGVVQEWHMYFDRMANHQKEYIRALSAWLKLSLIPIENNLKEKVLSPRRPENPPIQPLLLAWHEHLEKLPDEHTRGIMYNFAAALHTIVQQQEDELKLRDKVEGLTRDVEKKQRHYNKWKKEYTRKRLYADEKGGYLEDGIFKDETMVDKEFVIENAKRKLEEDQGHYKRQSRHVREKTLSILKTRLPELFRALSDFAYSSSNMYTNLKTICDSGSQGN